MSADQIITVLRRRLSRAISNDDLEEANRVLAQLKEEDPLSVETRCLELELLVQAGRLDEANQLSPQLIDQFPSSARVHYIAGKLAYSSRDYARAESLFTESHRLSAHPVSKRYVGKTLTQLGRYAEAETILTSLVTEHVSCHLDLAWLYERQKQFERALSHVDSFLAAYPDNQFALEQRSRLEGSTLNPDEFVEDVQSLIDHGEEVPDHLIPQYIENLIRTGHESKAREYLNLKTGQLKQQTVTSIAWVCYKSQVYDLACDLFLQAADSNRNQPKFLSALEAAADRCGRLAELLPIYRTWANDNPRFYGRIKNISRRLNG